MNTSDFWLSGPCDRSPSSVEFSLRKVFWGVCVLITSDVVFSNKLTVKKKKEWKKRFSEHVKVFLAEKPHFAYYFMNDCGEIIGPSLTLVEKKQWFKDFSRLILQILKWSYIGLFLGYLIMSSHLDNVLLARAQEKICWKYVNWLLQFLLIGRNYG